MTCPCCDNKKIVRYSDVIPNGKTREVVFCTKCARFYTLDRKVHLLDIVDFSNELKDRKILGNVAHLDVIPLIA